MSFFNTTPKKLRIYNEGTAIDVFYKRGNDMFSFNTAVIILCGFPDFPGPTPLTHFCCDHNTIVFQPHINGSFDSVGSFSIESAKSTFVNLNNLLTNGGFSYIPHDETYKTSWNFKKIVLISHSFGGIFAARCFNLIRNLTSIVLISSVLRYGDLYGCLENGPEHFKEVGKKFPFLYRLGDITLWNDILTGQDCLPVNPLGSVDTVLTIYGENDQYFALENVKKTILTLEKQYIDAKNYQLLIATQAAHYLPEIINDKDVQENLLKLF